MVNATGPLNYKDFDDAIILGSTIFGSFQSLQWNYKTNKLAFQPNPTTPTNFDPIVPSNNKKGNTLVIILIVIGVLLIIGGVVGYVMHSRKKLKSEIGQY